MTTLTFKMVNYFLFPVADTEANFMCFSTFTNKRKKIEVKINHKKLFIKNMLFGYFGVKSSPHYRVR